MSTPTSLPFTGYLLVGRTDGKPLVTQTQKAIGGLLTSRAAAQESLGQMEEHLSLIISARATVKALLPYVSYSGVCQYTGPQHKAPRACKGDVWENTIMVPRRAAAVS